MEELLHQGPGQFNPEALESISDQAIDNIRRNAILEPENQKKLGLVRKSITCSSFA